LGREVLRRRRGGKRELEVFIERIGK